jgi:hypothetical protein
MKKLFFVLLFVFHFAHAADFSLKKDECIILVASTKSNAEALEISKKYPGSVLYTSKSGYIAVGLEKISKQQSGARIKELLSAGKIPKGSNCADNTRVTGFLSDSESPTPNISKKQEQSKDTEVSGAGSIDFSQRTIGMCLGFIGKDASVRGAQNLHSSHAKYLKKHNSFFNDVLKTQRNHSQCFNAGVIISDCLQEKGVDSKIIGLMIGYNTGITNYKNPTDRAILEAACMEL